ncbi:MAG: 30S ribosomal protein S20 [Candidatus Levybacteria bacterium CG_4_10_14_0_2_um_filter_36_16]|nr:MAG: hypothetical protein AUK12_04460 [Candidatus Levybacteria bacterium CG2_30_37_29]PIR79361.1 MAG: 30S ribosomal protein S20 [Candidatus Levybacteria bacterium CG10_big_fil_rev_8_21_14_0_10_36_30]PIZ97789.1 MAG: 30S ribosomal protein S20 [Candidatus Levybacteria bacterium CG_4_10_14_0_2_um_filter_36_16]PJA90048.1 MAG: 30S ribosomal protein S20 [Candidatus Levybacteria bacterium CG_4_9_14_3_um_filter_36_7]
MPVIKSAIKKQRKDKKRTVHNSKLRKTLEEKLKKVKKSSTPTSVAATISLIDKAVKKNLIHKNKASRLKAKLTKMAKPVKKLTTKKAVAVKSSKSSTKTKKK